MTTDIATDTRVAAFNSSDFWHQLEVALDLAAADAECDHFVVMMIEEYTRHTRQLDVNTIMNAERRTMLRQALAICARH